jgi:hypothetical protein
MKITVTDRPRGSGKTSILIRLLLADLASKEFNSVHMFVCPNHQESERIDRIFKANNLRVQVCTAKELLTLISIPGTHDKVFKVYIDEPFMMSSSTQREILTRIREDKRNKWDIVAIGTIEPIEEKLRFSDYLS